MLRTILGPLLDAFRKQQQAHGDHEGDETTHTSLVPLDVSYLLSISSDGWFEGKDVTHVQTARIQKLVEKEPQGVCWHWTATRGVGYTLAKRIVSLPKPGERAASWGTLIQAKGPIIQSASLHHGTWHAGGPSSAAFKKVFYGGHRTWEMAGHPMSQKKPGEVSANSVLHGIELENLGELRMVNGAWRPYPFEPKTRAVPEAEVTKHSGRHYHRFSENQVTQAERIIRACHERFRWTSDAFRWNHHKIDPTRKTDAGPLWNQHLEDILSRVF